MKPIKATLIILLTTATLAVATERGVLWSGNWDNVYEVDIGTGSIYYSFSKPVSANTGLGYDGDYFWASYGSPPPVEPIVYKFDKDGYLISSFFIPAGDSCWSVTYENGTLWLIAYLYGPNERWVYHVDLNGSGIPPAPFKVHYLANDLTYDGEYIWVVAGEGTDCSALCYDPVTGVLLDSFQVGDPYVLETETRCIATDGTYIYTIGLEHMLEDTNWIYKYTKTGGFVGSIYTDMPGIHRGLSYYVEGVTAIEPLSFGKLKAIYR